MMPSSPTKQKKRESAEVDLQQSPVRPKKEPATDTENSVPKELPPEWDAKVRHAIFKNSRHTLFLPVPNNPHVRRKLNFNNIPVLSKQMG